MAPSKEASPPAESSKPSTPPEVTRSWASVAAGPRSTPFAKIDQFPALGSAPPRGTVTPSGRPGSTASSTPRNSSKSSSSSKPTLEMTTAFPSLQKTANLTGKEAKRAIGRTAANQWIPAYDVASATVEAEEVRQNRIFRKENELYIKRMRAEKNAERALNQEQTQAAIIVQQKLAAKGKSQFDLPLEITTEIILLLDFGSRHNLSKACKDTNALVKGVTQTWNVSTGDCGGAEQGKRVRLPPNRRDIVSQSAVTVIMVDENAPGSGYMGWELSMLKRAALAMFNVGDKIRRLEFHRTPLLTTRLLKYLIPDMPNLEYLGVFRCDLIDLLDTVDLLELIRRRRKYGVQLDFFPSEINRELENVEFSNAIPAILYRILPQALHQKAHLIDKGSAFYKYLRGLHIGITYKLLLAMEQEVIGQVMLCMARIKNKAISYVDPRSNDGIMWMCNWHQEPLPGCFFPCNDLKPNGKYRECWGCRFTATIKMAERGKGMVTKDLTRHVGRWLNKGRGLDKLISSARKDTPVPLARDQKWRDFWSAQWEEVQVAKHVEKGHLKPGQKLKHLKGRYRWLL